MAEAKRSHQRSHILALGGRVCGAMIVGCVYQGIFLLLLAGLPLASPALCDAVFAQILQHTRLDLPSMAPELGQLLCFNIAYLGVFYVAMGLSDNVGFARLTVYSRLTVVPASLLALALCGRVRYDCLVIAVPDAVFALWTLSELGSLSAAPRKRL